MLISIGSAQGKVLLPFLGRTISHTLKHKYSGEHVTQMPHEQNQGDQQAGGPPAIPEDGQPNYVAPESAGSHYAAPNYAASGQQQGQSQGQPPAYQPSSSQQPNYGAPNYGSPNYGAPAYGAPASGAANDGVPASGGPAYAAPTYATPGYGQGAPVPPQQGIPAGPAKTSTLNINPATWWTGAVAGAAAYIAVLLISVILMVLAIVGLVASNSGNSSEIPDNPIFSGADVPSPWAYLFALAAQLPALGMLGSLSGKIAVDVPFLGSLNASMSAFIVPLAISCAALFALYLANRFAEQLAPSRSSAQRWAQAAISGVVFSALANIVATAASIRIDIPNMGQIVLNGANFASVAVAFVLATLTAYVARNKGVARQPSALTAWVLVVRDAFLTSLAHLGTFVVIAVPVAVVVVAIKGGWAALLSSPLWAPTAGLSLFGVGHLAALGVSSGSSVGGGMTSTANSEYHYAFTGGLESFGIPWWAGLLLIVLAVIAVIAAAMIWYLRRGAQPLGNVLSWVYLPAAFFVVGVLVVWFSGFSVAFNAGAMASGGAGFGLAWWTPFLLLVWGIVTDVVSRVVAPRLVGILPARLVQLIQRGAVPVAAQATFAPSFQDQSFADQPFQTPSSDAPSFQDQSFAAQNFAAQSGAAQGDTPQGGAAVNGVAQEGVAPQVTGEQFAPGTLASSQPANPYPGAPAQVTQAQATQPQGNPYPGAPAQGATYQATQPQGFQAQQAQPQQAQAQQAQAQNSPYQGAAYRGAPAVPPRAPMSKKAKRNWIIAGAAALLVVVLAVGSIVAVNVIRNSNGPDKAVSAYLDAMVAGDATKAIELSKPTVPEGDKALLSNAVYAKTKDRISGYKILSTSIQGNRATVQAEVEVAGIKNTARYTLAQVNPSLLNSNWTLSGLQVSAIGLSVPEGTNKISVNGVDVPVSSSASASSRFLELPALPGTYTVSLPSSSKYLTGEPVKLTVGAGSTPVGKTGTLEAGPNEAFIKEANAQVSAALDKCTAQKVLRPKGCPFASYEFYDVRNVSWRVTKAPTLKIYSAGDGTFSFSSDSEGVATAYYEANESFSGPAKWTKSTDDAPIYLSGKITLDGDTLKVAVASY